MADSEDAANDSHFSRISKRKSLWSSRSGASVLSSITVSILIGCATMVPAAVVSNLGEAPETPLTVNDVEVVFLRIGNDIAQSFVTGSAAAFTAVTLSMADNEIGGSTFVVQLWSNSGGVPNTSLLTLTGNGSPATAGLYTYAAASPFALAASTTYWIVASVSHTAPDKAFNWNATSSTAESGDVGWSIGNNALSRTVVDGVPDSSWTDESSVAQMSITVVPEPAALWPLAGFLVMLGSWSGIATVRRNFGA